EKVKEGSRQMNKQMKFDGYTLYQSGYQENEFSDMTFGIYETDEVDGDSLGEVTIDTLKPDQEYETDSGFNVEVEQYYPEYEIKDGEPRSISKHPKKPAFMLE